MAKLTTHDSRIVDVPSDGTEVPRSRVADTPPDLVNADFKSSLITALSSSQPHIAIRTVAGSKRRVYK